MLAALVRGVFLPFRLLMRAFRWMFGFGAVRGASRGARTLRKAVGESAARRPAPEAEAAGEEAAARLTERDASDDDPSHDTASAAAPLAPPNRGLNTMFFKALPQPRLVERSAADMTLDEAKGYVDQANVFFSHPLNLFPEMDLFYEEVEQHYLVDVLGVDRGSIDARFIYVMRQFRCVLNDNTRLLMMVYAPLAFAAALAAYFAAPFLPEALRAGDTLAAASGWLTAQYVMGALATVVAILLVSLIYRFFYEVTQQRSLYGLNIYIGNKFARINQNFEVARRRSMNVERDKRMFEKEELKVEAAVWTIAYQWLALRLLLCDTSLRNTMFQVRRNSTLYAYGGQFLCVLFAGAAIAACALLPGGPGAGAAQIIIPATLLYMLIVYGVVLRSAFGIVVNILDDNQWSRFHMVNLPQTIAEHVGEDKVQILTFRDRNRVEG
ncbi:MAG: hypothetical protein AAF527_09835 [Pseudomonadota bacterium]